MQNYALSPTKSVKDFKRFSSRSSTNIRLHAALDQAKNYCDLVNHHLAKSKQRNHVLHTASLPFRKLTIQRHQSTSLSHRYQQKQKPYICNTQNVYDPQEGGILYGLTNKAGSIPYLDQKLRGGLGEKFQLELRMAELKTQISNERKIKDKLSIQNSRMMNMCQNSSKITNNMKKKSKLNSKLIQQVAYDIKYLLGQLEEAQIDNRKTSRKISEESEAVSQMKDIVHNKKKQLETETQLLNDIKFTQTVQYRKMENYFMQLTQLKQEKAQILNDIQCGVQKNI